MHHLFIAALFRMVGVGPPPRPSHLLADASGRARVRCALTSDGRRQRRAAPPRTPAGLPVGATDGSEHDMSACNRAGDSVVGTVGGGRSDDRRGDVAADAGDSSAGSSGLCGACEDAESGGSGSGAGDRADVCGSVGDGSGSSVSGAAGKRQRDDVQRGGKGKAQRRNKYADLSSRRGA